jgi:hypothetical protein
MMLKGFTNDRHNTHQPRGPVLGTALARLGSHSAVARPRAQGKDEAGQVASIYTVPVEHNGCRASTRR